MNSRNQQRFSKPGVLKSTTRVLGATAQQWDEALTGDFVVTLENYRTQAATNTSKKVNASGLSRRASSDVASSVKSHIAKKVVHHG